MEKSISNVNDITYKLRDVPSNFKFLLLIYAKRISQLVYVKLTEIEKIVSYLKSNNKIYEEDEIEDNEDDERLKALKQELSTLEKQTQETRLEIEKWKKEAKQRENLLYRPVVNLEALSDINSDINSRREQSVILCYLD